MMSEAFTTCVENSVTSRNAELITSGITCKGMDISSKVRFINGNELVEIEIPLDRQNPRFPCLVAVRNGFEVHHSYKCKRDFWFELYKYLAYFNSKRISEDRGRTRSRITIKSRDPGHQEMDGGTPYVGSSL